MKNVKEVIRGNDSTSLRFTSKNSEGELGFKAGKFSFDPELQVEVEPIFGDVEGGNYTEIEDDGTIVTYGEGTTWNEISQSFVGQNIYVNQGRIDYNYDELSLDYTTTARYPNEFAGSVKQMPHERANNTNIRPHIHWIQNQNVMPNILIEYRAYNNGQEVPAVWVQKALTSADNLFTYTSGDIQQITEFDLPASVGESLGLSGTFEAKIYRDSQNTSGLFAGADAYTGSLSLKYYDIHYVVDMSGSREEFTK